MTEPLEPTTYSKMLWTLIGSVIGSLSAIGVSPAENRRDAVIRSLVGIVVSACLVPVTVRGICRWCSVSTSSILDVTLAVGCVLSLSAWWLAHAIVMVAKKRAHSTLESALDRATKTENHHDT